MLIPNSPKTVEWVANKCEADPRIACASIGWESEGMGHTCGVFYENYTGKSITATIAVEPGCVMPKEFLRTIFAYPFQDLGCWKIVALVAESNYRSQTMLEKMGFVREATVTDYYPDGDLFIYTMTKLQCRFLEKEHGKEDQDA